MEQKSRTTGSERCPGEAALPGPEFRGTLCPHLPGVQDRESVSTCAGAKRRRPASSLEKNPPTSLPSPLPLRKRVKKKKKSHSPPPPGERQPPPRRRALPGPAGACTVPRPARRHRFEPRPRRRGVSNVRDVDFHSSGGRHSFLSREDRSEPEEDSQSTACQSVGPSRTVLAAVPRLAFLRDSRALLKGFPSLSPVRGRGLQEKSPRGGCY